MANMGFLQKVKALAQRVAQTPFADDPRVVEGLRKLLGMAQGQQAPDQPSGSLYEKAKAVFELAGGNPQAFVNYLRQIPDPELNNLVNQRSLLESIVRQLVGENAGKLAPAGDGMPPPPLQSSNVAGFRYFPKRQQLEVKFHNGGIYQYQDVPPWVYKLFALGKATAKTTGKNKFGSWFVGKNPSLGAAVWRYLRAGGFPYQRLK